MVIDKRKKVENRSKNKMETNLINDDDSNLQNLS